MSRIVETHISHRLGCIVQTIMKDGTTSNVEYKNGDVAEYLHYIYNDDVVSITGRIDEIAYKYTPTVRTYNDITKIKSYFADDVIINSLSVDCSKQYHADVKTVPAKEIVEKANLEQVSKVRCFAKYYVDVEVELSNSTLSQMTFIEGQELVGLEYIYYNKEYKIDCHLVTIKHDSELNPTDLVVISDGKIKTIPLTGVIKVDTLIDPVNSNNNITDVLAKSKTGTVVLESGTYKADVQITKDTVIKGAYAGVPATNLSLRNANKQSLETVVSGKLEVAENVSLTLDGITLTDDAYLHLKNCTEVKLENCRVVGLTPTAAKSFAVLTRKDDAPAKMTVKGCYFGANPGADNNAFYNLFELACKLKDGSEISGNIFATDANNNNTICIYNVEDGATVTIKDNTWEKSANGIRIGTMGDAKCTINVDNNTYLSTPKEYPGLLLVQPYGKATTNMSGVVININNTTHNDEFPVYYMYAGGGDMQFTESNVPTIKVDGKTEVKPVVTE